MGRVKGSKNKSKEEKLTEILDETEIPFEELEQDSENNDTDEDSKEVIIQVNDYVRIVVTKKIKIVQVLSKGKHPITKEETERWKDEGYHVWWRELLHALIRTCTDLKILNHGEIKTLKEMKDIFVGVEKDVNSWFGIHIANKNIK